MMPGPVVTTNSSSFPLGIKASKSVDVHSTPRPELQPQQQPQQRNAREKNEEKKKGGVELEAQDLLGAKKKRAI